jgi:hypothetical protein
MAGADSPPVPAEQHFSKALGSQTPPHSFRTGEQVGRGNALLLDGTT